MADEVVLTRQVTGRGVHQWAQRPGGACCADVVRDYTGYEEWAGGGFQRREVARCGVALILGFGDPMDVFDGDAGDGARQLRAFVVGNQSRSSVTGVTGHQLGVQVELTPVGALTLFGDVEAFNDTVVPLEDVLGERGADLTERLASLPRWAQRLDFLDATFGSGDAADLSALSPEVEWLRLRLIASAGRERVEPLMDQTGWSRRLVTERFRRQLGVPPKAYARLLRFGRARALLAASGTGRTIAHAAMEAGYYDQSHLTRDFVSLAGVTPGALVAQQDSAPEVRFVQDAVDAVSAH